MRDEVVRRAWADQGDQRESKQIEAISGRPGGGGGSLGRGLAGSAGGGEGGGRSYRIKVNQSKPRETGSGRRRLTQSRFDKLKALSLPTGHEGTKGFHLRRRELRGWIIPNPSESK